MVSVGEQLIALKQRSSLSLHEIASRANYRGRSSIQKFFSADYDPPALDDVVAGRLARALVGEGSPPISEEEVFGLTRSQVNSLPRYNYKELPNLKRDVAVYICMYVEKRPIITNQPPISLYLLERDNPVQYCWHPPGMVGDNDLYGLNLPRMPLLPRYRPGELVFINPHKVAAFGDDVCIKLVDYDEEPEMTKDIELPTSTELVTFATFVGQTATHMLFQSLDGEVSFRVNSDTVLQAQPLFSLTQALAS